jgi:hypothetical protein
MRSILVSRIKNIKSQDVFLLFALLFLFLMLRWNTFSMPFERDEGEYAYSAWILRQGIMPYENSFLQKPPMIVYTYAFGQLFDPVGVVSPKVLEAIFSLGTILCTFLIAKRRCGTNAGWVSVFLLSPMLVLPYNAAFAANTEHFMLLPLMGLLVIYFYKRGQEKPIHFFWAGSLAALSILYKPFPVYIISFIFIIWLIQVYQDKKNIGLVVIDFLLIIVGGILTTIIVLLPFILSGKFNYLLESAVIYNRYYVEFIGYSMNAFIAHNTKVFRVYWPFLLLLGYYVYKKPKDWWLYIALFAISLVSIYQSWINHYYIFIMPFLALIASFAILILGKNDTVQKFFKGKTEPFITGTILILIIFPFRQQFSLTPAEMSLYIYGSVNPFYEAPLVANKVVENSIPSDRVFIAGSEPEILFYAKRRSPGRFMITYPFNITTSLREKYQKEGVLDLTNNPPKVIVYSTRVHSGLWNEGSPTIFIDYLEKLINDKYKIKGSFVWENGKGFWLDNPTAEDLKLASLILYVRK